MALTKRKVHPPATIRTISSRSPACTGSCSQAGGVVTCSLGTLTNAGRATVTCTVRTTAEGILSHMAQVGASLTDLNPGNNSATVMVTVLALAVLAIERQGNIVVVSWPASATGFVLEASDNLTSPNWTAVGGVTIVGSRFQATASVAPGPSYYRLRGQ